MPAESLEERLEDGDDGVLVAGDHQHAAELVEQHQQLRAPHVLVVHDLLQVVPPSEVVQQPAGSRAREHVGQKQLKLILQPQGLLSHGMQITRLFGLCPSFA